MWRTILRLWEIGKKKDLPNPSLVLRLMNEGNKVSTQLGTIGKKESWFSLQLWKMIYNCVTGKETLIDHINELFKCKSWMSYWLNIINQCTRTKIFSLICKIWSYSHKLGNT